jgi:L-rhamnose mutarotase
MDQAQPEPRYGPTNPTPEEQDAAPVKRLGSVIGLKPDMEQHYRELHANVWPSILDRLRRSHIRDYSIYVTEIEGRKYLFSYLEYAGTDLASDMRAIAEDPETQRWWKETDPCQIPLPSRQPGENWSEMEMVFLMENAQGEEKA